MKGKFKTFITSFLAALFMATLIVPIAACTEDTDNTGDPVVTVVSMGNKGLEGVTVRATNGENTIAGKTDKDGKTSLAIDKSLTYQVTFEDLPKGYYADTSTSYKIEANSSNEIKFYLPSKVIEGESVDPQYVYKTGDVMYDFSFTTTTNASRPATVVTLSEELKTKKAVVINFWGSLCSNCQVEFPAIEKTYKMFENDLSVLALDPPGAYGDTDAKIVSTLSQWRLDLSFYYGLDQANLFKNFYAPAQNGSFVLPISAIIDRYGVVCEIIVGSESDEEVWKKSIAYYVSDEYVPNIKEGHDAEGEENFVPDKPADFQAKMSDPVEIDRAINKTGTDILFYADEGEYSWPWALSSDGKSIVPLGSGHGLSYSIIYADITIPAGKALLVDYKVSTYEDFDLFEIVVDNNDLGRVSFIDSGNKDWATALAYIPLEAGEHQIAFVYYKGTQKGQYEDTVYLNNLRFVDITSEQIPTMDVSYYAARSFDSRNSIYRIYEEVYLDNTDGYYHVKGRESGGKDPYLLLDMTHMIPYTRGASLYAQFINDKQCIFGGKNYYNELMSYAYVAANSAVEGAVPVTKELHDILVELCKHDAGADAYAANPNLWLEFCIFYMHYGKGSAMDDPAKGYAYFSAYEAKVTDVYDTATAMEQINTIYNAYDEIANNPDADVAALQALIKSTQDEYEANLAKYNSVDFDTVIVPRGKVVKFTAPSAGVYHFYSVGREDNPEYVCQAELFTSDLKLHTTLARPVASHDSDTLFRDGSPTQFHLYHYLKEGESCYLNLMFYSSETIDTMYYAVNKVSDTEYKSLKTVTAGFLTTSLDPDTLNKIYRPLFTKVTFNSADNKYYASNGSNIYVDFTGVTRFSTSHTLEQVIKAAASGHPLKMDNLDVTFDLSDVRLTIGGETLVGKDYTQKIQEYLDAATANPDDPEYGLAEANKELRDILLLFIHKYDEILDDNEWLTFCYFYEYFGANY